MPFPGHDTPRAIEVHHVWPSTYCSGSRSWKAVSRCWDFTPKTIFYVLGWRVSPHQKHFHQPGRSKSHPTLLCESSDMGVSLSFGTFRSETAPTFTRIICGVEENETGPSPLPYRIYTRKYILANFNKLFVFPLFGARKSPFVVSLKTADIAYQGSSACGEMKGRAVPRKEKKKGKKRPATPTR